MKYPGIVLRGLADVKNLKIYITNSSYADLDVIRHEILHILLGSNVGHGEGGFFRL